MTVGIGALALPLGDFLRVGSLAIPPNANDCGAAGLKWYFRAYAPQRRKRMILDTLENGRRYFGVHAGFRKAFEFLSQADPANLSPGRKEIEGDRLYALVSRGPGRGRREARLETHARYIDVQYVISGIDMMGWKPASACRRATGPFDPEKDVGFFEDDPETWIAVHSGSFAVFFPEDAHMPLLSAGEIHKIVVKVAVDAIP